MNTQTPVIIFSVCRADRAAYLNRDATSAAENALNARGIPYFNATGAYAGTREDSFVIQDIGENRLTAWTLAKWHAQDSILCIDANGMAGLEYLDGRPRTPLGRFREVSEQYARDRDAWTECNGRYFVAG